jgi:hypothetical protein
MTGENFFPVYRERKEENLMEIRISGNISSLSF